MKKKKKKLPLFSLSLFFPPDLIEQDGGYSRCFEFFLKDVVHPFPKSRAPTFSLKAPATVKQTQMAGKSQASSLRLGNSLSTHAERLAKQKGAGKKVPFLMEPC